MLGANGERLVTPGKMTFRSQDALLHTLVKSSAPTGDWGAIGGQNCEGVSMAILSIRTPIKTSPPLSLGLHPKPQAPALPPGACPVHRLESRISTQSPRYSLLPAECWWGAPARPRQQHMQLCPGAIFRPPSPHPQQGNIRNPCPGSARAERL